MKALMRLTLAALTTALMFAGCDATEPTDEAAIDIITPQAEARVSGGGIRLQFVARTPRAGAVSILEWFLSGSSIAYHEPYLLNPPNLERRQRISVDTMLPLLNGNYTLTVRMHYYADAENTNAMLEVARQFRVTGGRRIEILDGLADTLYQRSLMVTVRDLAGSDDQWYVNLLMDPGTPDETLVNNEATAANQFRPPFERLQDGRRRFYFLDTLAPGPHRVALMMYDATGFVDSLSAPFHIVLPLHTYSLSVLPPLGDGETSASAMNDMGDVVGWAVNQAGVRVAVRWRAGSVEALDTVPSEAVTVNAAGEVFGVITAPDRCSVRWKGGTRQELRFTDGTCVPTMVSANNDGTVLASLNSGQHYVIRNGEPPVALVSPPGQVYYPKDINDREWIVGSHFNFYREEALGLGFSAEFPGPYPWQSHSPHWTSRVWQINNTGQFIGTATHAGTKIFFGQAGTESIDMGGVLSITKQPRLLGLSEDGTVLAFDYVSQHGFLWHAGRTSRFTIDDPNWSIESLTGIDTDRRIIGRASHRTTGQKRAVVLTPVDGD